MPSRTCVAAALAGGVVSAGPARATVVKQWVQFAPDGTVLIRAVEDDPNNGCPAVSVDGRQVALAQPRPSDNRGGRAQDLLSRPDVRKRADPGARPRRRGGGGRAAENAGGPPAPHPGDRRHRLPGHNCRVRHPELQRPAAVPVGVPVQLRRDVQAGPDRPCRRLLLPRAALPHGLRRLRGQPGVRQLGIPGTPIGSARPGT